MFGSRSVLLICLTLALSGCARDFERPELIPAIVELAVAPGLAKAGDTLQISFRTTRPLDEPPQVRLLGQLANEGSLKPDGSYLFSYPVMGDEPEGADVELTVTGLSSGQSLQAQAWVRFDFTPPAVMSVSPSASTVSPDQLLSMDFLFSEDLAQGPEVTILDQSLPCTEIGIMLYRCTFTPDSSMDTAWLNADLALSDRAGNQATLNQAIGAALDSGQDFSIELTDAAPQPATRGMNLHIGFTSPLPLSAPPQVLLAGQTATYLQGPDQGGQYSFVYFVTGTELGQSHVQDFAPLTISAQGPGGSTGSYSGQVFLDFAAPLLTGMSASPQLISVGDQVSISLTFDDPVAAITATVQGLPVHCPNHQLPAREILCTYLASGSEQEGAQELVLRPMDELGNEQATQVEGGFSFDFVCHQDPNKVFLATGYGRPAWLQVEAQAFEPGAQVTAYDSPGGDILAGPLTVGPDGGVSNTPLPGLDVAQIWIRAIDQAGHQCNPIAAANRFVADFVGTDEGTNPNLARTLVVGSPQLHLAAIQSQPAMASHAVLLDTDDEGSSATATVTEPADWTNLGDLPNSPYGANESPMVYSPYHQAVMRVEKDGGAMLVNYWDGSNWSWSNPDGGTGGDPPVERDFGLALELSTDSLLLFGGGRSTSGPYDDFWKMHQDTWQMLTTNPSPQARLSPGFTFDPANGETLLFGGYGSTSSLADTHTWDGTGWQEHDQLTSSPSPRYSCQATYDSLRRRVVLHGGAGQAGVRYSDVWEWTGSEWIEMHPDGAPAERLHHGQAFHAGRGATVIYGGYSETDHPLRNDLWEYNGHSWTQITTASPGPALLSPGLAYDPMRGNLVLYGGFDNDGYFSWDLWELSADALYPVFQASLALSEQIYPFSQVRFRISAKAYGQGPTGQIALGLNMSLWDSDSKSWLTIHRQQAPDMPPDEYSSFQIDLSGYEMERYSSDGRIFVLLVPDSAAGPEMEVSLEVDNLEMIVDTH